MLGIDATLLAQMRADVGSLLPTTAALYRRAEVVDSAGNVKPMLTYQRDVLCRIDPISNQRASQLVANQELVVGRYQLTMAHDADLQKNDQLDTDGKRYEVVLIQDEHSWRVSVRGEVLLVE